MNERKDEREGKRTLEHRYDSDTPAVQPGNPSGVAEGECDVKTHTEGGTEHDDLCHWASTSHIDDKVMEESKPGGGIPGYEGEEVGG
ncbi:MAG TPA: hypothetical protein VLA05_01200 [Coriobacteriia bacterium]|nr:hypothetical protein [Coriobacteriia bacterium]